MARVPLRIIDLPPEILQEIFSYLNIRNFTNLTSCTPALFPFRDDSIYWSTQVKQNFRVPDHLERKGKPWSWLYKKILTQTQLYTWGSNKNGNLGHVNPSTPGYEQLAPYPNTTNALSPKQPCVQIYLGVLTEVQCGGWCTTLRNTDGDLFVMGTVNENAHPISCHGYHLRPLTFPPDWARHSNRVIQQYSTGRTTVLGLAETGEVWQWSSDAAILLFLPVVEIGQRKVLEVQAGWNKNAILVKGEGIAYWVLDRQSDLIAGRQQQTLSPKHRMTVETVTIPGTGFHPDLQADFAPDSLDAQIGQVKHFVILQGHIIFVTAKNRIFSYYAVDPRDARSHPPPTELTTFYPTNYNPVTDPPFEISSLAGSYCSFAIITTSHGVSIGYLSEYDLITPTCRLPGAGRPPHLQENDVVSISFGDYHFHALHTNGSVTSLGIASGHCGALGVPNQHLVSYPQSNPYLGGPNGEPVGPSCKAVVQFEPLMNDWLERLAKNTQERNQSLQDEVARWNWKEQDAFTEGIGQWLETESAKWADGVKGRPNGSSPAWHHDASASPLPTPRPWQIPPQTHQESTYNHHSRKYQHPPLPIDNDIPPYFALNIAAGGWHSAALVLVDQFKAERVREVYRVPVRHLEGGPGVIEGGRRVGATGGGGGLWEWGRKFLGLQRRDEREEEQREKWVWEREVLPSRLLEKPVVDQ